MGRISNIPDSTVEWARKVVKDSASDNDLFKAISILCTTKGGLSVDQVTDILQISRATYFRYRAEVIQSSIDGKFSESNWGGRRNSFLTKEEEENFLSQFNEEAAQGLIVSANKIHQALVQLIGHKIPISTTIRMLQRNNWRKVKPDTRHPKADEAAQEDFKKKCRYIWIPPLNKTKTSLM